ncbi:pyrimidine-nucleoside phosphorylase, partial [Clostridium perfringens]|nr:pyrimidine-nucleoside phosphorylase [Clostridium perfringens]
GLGHTGGTLDKLEAVPGFDINVSKENFINFVNKSGLVIAGQTQNIVPADKKLYALRDVTATIDSISLIAASIMSKKIASGSDAILLDVKYGDGAFMKTKEDAEKLAEAMVSIGKGLNRNTSAAITLN